MSRRHAIVLALALAAATTWPAQASARASDTSVSIRGVDTEAFPEVTVTVSITGSDVNPDDVQVTENGTSVGDVEATALTDTGQDVDVVLAVDTSDSMKGAPLAAAIAAALKFVTSIPSDGQLRVGIVTFAGHPEVLQPLTTEQPTLLASLGSLSTSPGTSLYDGVVEAAHMLSGSGQNNIVLLSDGGDRSSQGTLKDAVAAAKEADAAVFSLGLKSPDTDVKALQALSKATGGRYAPATTADLASLYAQLATELSNQFLVTYRSARKSGGQVTVAVSAAGGTDSALVLEPKIAPPPGVEAPPEASSSPLLGGQAGLLTVLILSFLAFFLILNLTLGARARNRRDRELVRRVASKPQAIEEAATGDRSLVSWMPAPMVQAGEKVAEAAGMGTKVALMLERGGLPLRAGEFVAGVMLAGLAGVLVGGILLHNPIFMLLIGGAFAIVPIVWLKVSMKKRTGKLHTQLADILMILASSLRAGHGFFQALDLVAKEIGEPGSQEFGRVVAEVRLGRPVDEALNAMAERIGSDDFKWAVLGVNIQREVGGNLAEILDTIADTVRERDAVRRQIGVLSAEGRLSIGILASLPFLVMLYMAKMNPEYLNLLFTTRVGLIMVVTAGCLLVTGILWMRKIVRINV